MGLGLSLWVPRMKTGMVRAMVGELEMGMGKERGDGGRACWWLAGACATSWGCGCCCCQGASMPGWSGTYPPLSPESGAGGMLVVSAIGVLLAGVLEVVPEGKVSATTGPVPPSIWLMFGSCGWCGSCWHVLQCPGSCHASTVLSPVHDGTLPRQGHCKISRSGLRKQCYDMAAITACRSQWLGRLGSIAAVGSDCQHSHLQLSRTVVLRRIAQPQQQQGAADSWPLVPSRAASGLQRYR